MAKAAFIGTGNMGVEMAARLINAGHDLRVFNRTAAKAAPLEKAGAYVASSPADAVQGAQAIFVMVGDDAASDKVWNGETGILTAELTPDVIAIECSTLSYDWVQTLSRTVEAKGLSYLDCPVTGVPAQAAVGDLTLLIGGKTEIIEKAQTFLSPLSSSYYHFGDIGAGTAYKLIINLMGSVHIVALAEGLLAAEKAGLDMGTVVKALSTGAVANTQVKSNGPVMISGKHDENVGFSALWRLKDTDYGVKFARQMGTAPALGLESLKQFQKLVDEGYQDSSGSKVIDVMRR